MAQQSRKNLTDKNRSAEFDTEIEYQDKSRPNARPSEPSRTSNSKPSAIDKEKVANTGAAKKNV